MGFLFRDDQMKGVLLLLFLSLVWAVLSRGGAWKNGDHAASPFPADGGEKVIAAFRGEEDKEGVYALSEGSTVKDLLAAAGWKPPGEIPPGALNRVLQRGDRVTPTKGPEGTPSLAVDEMPAAEKLVLGLPVDLNGASLEDLERVPGIGRKTAEALLRHREKEGPLKSLEDLKEITTLGDRKIEEIGKHGFVRQESRNP